MQNYAKNSAIFYKIADQIPVEKNIPWHNLIYCYGQSHDSKGQESQAAVEETTINAGIPPRVRASSKQKQVVFVSFLSASSSVFIPNPVFVAHNNERMK